MQTLQTKLSGPILLAPTVHGDERGFFVETFRHDALPELGVADGFVQDNHSRSRQGIVRGMHFQPGQAKLVRCARGAILDVVVDIRVGSPQFGEWEGFTLDDVEHRQLYVPDGFAHGFCVLSDLADVTYKVSSYYDPEQRERLCLQRSRRRDRVAQRGRAARVRAGPGGADAGRDRGVPAVPLHPGLSAAIPASGG